MIVFDEDDLEGDNFNLNVGSVGKIMPRSALLNSLSSAPDSTDVVGTLSSDKELPSSLDSTAVDSVVLDTLALVKDPQPPATSSGCPSAAQDSMQLFFDDSDMVEDASTSERVDVILAPAAPAPAAATSAPFSHSTETKVYGRKNRDGVVAGGITAFFAPAPKVVETSLPTPAATEEDDVSDDAEDDVDADDDADQDSDSDAGSVDSAASLARRLMEEQRRRQQEAFKVPVAAQVRKDIIDVVGEKGRYWHFLSFSSQTTFCSDPV
jgi:hypothetical protein